MGSRPGRRRLVWMAAALVPACASLFEARPDPMRYRLTDSGEYWDVVGTDRVLDDVGPRYPEFFAIILDPARHDEPNLGPLRDDLEQTPVDRRNYDALNAVAIAYFEINFRGEQVREIGSLTFMSEGFRAAHLAAVPWRAYGLVEAGALRDAILDFFEDATLGQKLGARTTGRRLAGLVESFESVELDARRLDRIRALIAALEASEPSPPAAPPAWAD
ncbi:MAG: hypothetical protein JSU66_16580 [Deltaproteobacteria bacterium]|nr:MAG: hypothetical protein JSU66_16580 [Deltaproteobacteria bacterium]